MSAEGEGKEKEAYTTEHEDLPGDEELRVAPLFSSRARTTTSTVPPPSQEQEGQIEEATLSYSPASKLPPISIDNEEFQVAPLSLRRRRSTPAHTLPTGQDDFGIKPLVIKKVARPTTPDTAKPRPSSKTESSPPPYLSQNTSFEPETPPPRTLVFSEQSSPEVVNRRLRTGPSVTVTPLEPAESDHSAPQPTFAFRVPPEDLFESPELLRVPHSSGKAADLSYSFVVFPSIGGTQEPETSSNMSDKGEEKPQVLETGAAVGDEEASGTPPNTSVEPAPQGDVPAGAEEYAGAFGYADKPKTGDENPIEKDLTPSQGPFGSSSQIAETHSQSQGTDTAPSTGSEAAVSPPISRPSRGAGGLDRSTRKARLEKLHGSRKREAANEAVKDKGKGPENPHTPPRQRDTSPGSADFPGAGGHGQPKPSVLTGIGRPQSDTHSDHSSLQRTHEDKKPYPKFGGRIEPIWRDLAPPSSRNNIGSNEWVPKYEDSQVNPDDDVPTKGKNKVVTLGSRGDPPEIEEERDREARAYLERETIKARHKGETSPRSADERAAAFEYDRTIEFRNKVDQPQEVSDWEDWARQPENRDKDCRNLGNAMLQILKQKQTELIGDVAQALADTLNFKKETEDMRKETQKLREKRRESDDLIAELKEKQETVMAAHKKELKELKEETGRNVQERDELRDDRYKLEQKVNGLQNAIKKQHDKDKTECDTAKAGLQAEIDRLVKELDAAKTKDTTDEENAALRREIKAAADHMDQLQKGLDRTNARQFEEQMEAEGIYQATVKRLGECLEGRDSQATELIECMEGRVKEATEAAANIRSLKEEIEDLKSLKSELTRRVKAAMDESAGNMKLLIKTVNQFKEAKNDLVKCHKRRDEAEEELGQCKERGVRMKKEVDDLKNELREQRLGGSQSFGTSVPPNSSKSTEKRSYQSSARTQHTPPANSRRSQAQAGPKTPPGQMIPSARSPPNTQASQTTNSSVMSAPDYDGPQPVTRSIVFAVTRCKAALRTMRDARAQHGFQDGDCERAIRIAREVYSASLLLPLDNGARTTLLGEGAYLQGVSYYYADEAQRGAVWFREAASLDPADDRIEVWLQRIKGGGPDKDAEYFMDLESPRKWKGRESSPRYGGGSRSRSRTKKDEAAEAAKTVPKLTKKQQKEADAKKKIADAKEEADLKALYAEIVAAAKA